MTAQDDNPLARYCCEMLRDFIAANNLDMESHAGKIQISSAAGDTIEERVTAMLVPRQTSAGDGPSQPRLIIAIEAGDRTIDQLFERARTMFWISQLRSALFLKEFAEQDNGGVSCATILFGTGLASSSTTLYHLAALRSVKTLERVCCSTADAFVRPLWSLWLPARQLRGLTS